MYSEIDELNCMCKYDNISSNFRKNREKRKKTGFTHTANIEP